MYAVIPLKSILFLKKTQKIERQTLHRAVFRFRTHLKRLVRQTICFSKKDDMPYLLMWAIQNVKIYIEEVTQYSNLF